MRTLLVASMLLVGACATAGTGSLVDDDTGFGVGGATSNSATGFNASTTTTTGSGGCGDGEMSCGGACVDPLANNLHCGGCDQQCPSSYACVQGQCQQSAVSSGPSANVSASSASTASSANSSGSGASSSASSVSSSVSSSSVATAASTGSGVMNCDPMNPGLNCGANKHCVPQQAGMPICSGPTGNGGQYAACNSPAQCAPAFECVETPYLTVYCMQWCTNDFDCPGALDLCEFFSPGLYVGGLQYGVCYDGYP